MMSLDDFRLQFYETQVILKRVMLENCTHRLQQARVNMFFNVSSQLFVNPVQWDSPLDCLAIMSFMKKPKAIDPNEVDPSVYYYDEVYDDMKDEKKSDKSKEKSKSGTDKPEGAKYIDNLKKSAEIRKTDSELRKFRKYTQDREYVHEDEEVYITSAYKKKLAEMKALEEEKKRQLKLEDEKSMNFLNTQSKNRGELSSFSSSSAEKSAKDKLDPKSGDLMRETQESDPRDTNKSKTDHPKTEKRKQAPRTYKEKKHYLRKVLAKRNIGDKLREAVRRYRERKATDRFI